MYQSHIWPQPRDSPSAFVVLHGTRRSSSPFSTWESQLPFFLCLCKQRTACMAHLSSSSLRSDFSFLRNLESVCPDLSLNLYSEPLAQEKAWVTSNFSSLASSCSSALPPPPAILQAIDSLYVLSQWAENLERISGL